MTVKHQISLCRDSRLHVDHVERYVRRYQRSHAKMEKEVLRVLLIGLPRSNSQPLIIICSK